MDNNNQALGSINRVAKNRATPVTKRRKWREIESIKEKFQLEKDLRVYGDSLEYMLEDF
jgi:hypothetical protein